MSQFQPVPTYADPVLVEQKTGKSAFNPVWLSWFLTLSAGGLSGVTSHNDLSGLQGGLPTQRYHLSLSEYENVVIRNLVAPQDIVVGASPFLYQNVNSYDVDVIIQGTLTSKVEFSRDNVTFYDCGSTQGMFHASPSDFLRITYTGLPAVTEVSR